MPRGISAMAHRHNTSVALLLIWRRLPGSARRGGFVPGIVASKRGQPRKAIGKTVAMRAISGLSGSDGAEMSPDQHATYREP